MPPKKRKVQAHMYGFLAVGIAAALLVTIRLHNEGVTARSASVSCSTTSSQGGWRAYFLPSTQEQPIWSMEPSCRDPYPVCNDSAPRFVTYMVDAGRWSVCDAKSGLRMMYSALVKAHVCAPILYVYTNYNKDAIPNVTLMGTAVRIVVKEPIPVDNIYSPSRGPLPEWKGEKHNRKWIALSRSKVDVVAGHLDRGEKVIWIDLDTLVMHPLFRPYRSAGSWFVTEQVHGSSEINGQTIHPRNKAYGDLWMMNQQTIRDLEELERLIPPPLYDVQDYASLLLEKQDADLANLATVTNSANVTRSHINRLQETETVAGTGVRGCWGFAFSKNHIHPFPGNIRLAVAGGTDGDREQHLTCDDDGAEKSTMKPKDQRVMSMSFTHDTFTLLSAASSWGAFFVDPDVASWLAEYFAPPKCNGTTPS